MNLGGTTGGRALGATNAYTALIHAAKASVGKTLGNLHPKAHTRRLPPSKKHARSRRPAYGTSLKARTKKSTHLEGEVEEPGVDEKGGGGGGAGGGDTGSGGGDGSREEKREQFIATSKKRLKRSPITKESINTLANDLQNLRSFGEDNVMEALQNSLGESYESHVQVVDTCTALLKTLKNQTFEGKDELIKSISTIRQEEFEDMGEVLEAEGITDDELESLSPKTKEFIKDPAFENTRELFNETMKMVQEQMRQFDLDFDTPEELENQFKNIFVLLFKQVGVFLRPVDPEKTLSIAGKQDTTADFKKASSLTEAVIKGAKEAFDEELARKTKNKEQLNED